MPPSAITGTSALDAASAADMDRGQLRHADPGHDPGGADGAGPDADLDRIGAGIDQRLGTVGRGHVAGDDLGIIAQPLGLLDPLQHALGMAMRRVDHQHVDAGIEQSLGPRQPLVAGAGGGCDAQPALLVLAGIRVQLRLLDVLDGDEADTAVVVVGDQQLLDAVLVQQALGGLAVGALGHR